MQSSAGQPAISTHRVVVTLRVPSGWVPTGEYRCPKRREHGIDQAGLHGEADFDYRTTKWFILKPDTREPQ